MKTIRILSTTLLACLCSSLLFSACVSQELREKDASSKVDPAAPQELQTRIDYCAFAGGGSEVEGAWLSVVDELLGQEVFLETLRRARVNQLETIAIGPISEAAKDKLVSAVGKVWWPVQQVDVDEHFASISVIRTGLEQVNEPVRFEVSFKYEMGGETSSGAFRDVIYLITVLERNSQEPRGYKVAGTSCDALPVEEAPPTGTPVGQPVTI